ncbi:beta strand repeat-containing protein [Poriferisphaera sp. WC338]|uniref:beta strand repeat-containing protein n=1 Tax=Poriferisphaera sp. WC338 TaxID=3425129 RepID=UPI003D8185B8
MSHKLIGLTCLSMMGAAQLQAADVTFTGGTSNVWTVDSNWAGGTAPAANVDGVITIESGNGASPFTLTGIDLSYINMNGLTLSSSGTDGDYTLTGTGSFTFNDGTIIENAKTGSMTIDVDVIGTGTELALEAVTGNIFVSGNVDLSDSGGVILAIDGLSGVDVSGVISGTGGNVELLGPNTVTLSGDNTYTGGTAISANGTLILGNDNALGTDALTIAASSTIQSDDDARVIDNDINVTSGNLTIGGSNDLMLNGDITGTLTGVVIDTTGTLTLAGNNTINGDMLVNSDATIVAGSDNALGTSTFGISANATLESDNDARTISTLINVNNGFTLTMGGSNDLTIGAIVGDGGLGKTGTGALTLTGNNTYTGGTTLSAGTVVLGNDNAFSTGDVTVNNIDLQSNDDARAISNNFSVGNGGTLFYSGSNNLTLDGVISGAGRVAITDSGSGTLTLNGVNTYSGNTLLTGGANLALGDDDALGVGTLIVETTGGTISSGISSLTIGNQIDLDANGSLTLDLTNDNNITLDGVISSSGSVTINGGANRLTLNGNNTYSGGTTLNGGITVLGHDNAFGTGSVNLILNSSVESDDDARSVSNDFSLTGSATLGFLGNNDLTLSGVISGTGGLAKNTNTVVTLTGSNTFSGASSISAGTIVLGNDNALGTGTLVVTGASSLQSNDDARSINNAIGLTDGLTVVGSNDLALTGAISGGGSLTKTGSSTLTLEGGNTYSGGTTLNAGTLVLGHDNALGTGSLSVTDNGTIESDSNARTISNNIALQGGNLSIAGSNDLDLSGDISSTASFEIQINTTGRLTLGGNNTYTGDTMLNAGALVMGNDNALGSGALVVASDAELVSDNNARSFSNFVLLNTGATLTRTSRNDLTITGTISGDGALSNSGDSLLTLTGSNTYTGGTILSSGTIVLGNDSALGTGAMGVTGESAIQSNNDARSIGNTIDITVGNILTVSGSNDLALTGLILGSGGLGHSSTGTLTLTGNNSYEGGTQLSNGTIILGHDNALGTALLGVGGDANIQSNDNARSIANSVTIGSGATLTIDGANNLEMTDRITGDGALAISVDSSNAVRLSGDSTYSGGTTLSEGMLAIAHSNALGTGTLTITSNDTAILSNDDNVSLSNAISLGGNTLSVASGDDLALTGVISGSGAINFNNNSILELAGNNTYTGDTTIAVGRLVLGHDNALGTGDLVIGVDPDVTSNDDSVVIGNNVTIINGNTLTVTGSNDFEMTGILSGGSVGGIDLAKEGTGTVTLSGNSTYTGSTVVRAGTLIVNGSLASNEISVLDGATLSGVMNFAGNYINSGTMSPGNSPGTMIVGGNLTLNSTSIYDMEIQSTAGPGTGNDFIDVTGTAAIDGTLNVIGLGGYSATDGDTFTILDADGGVSGTFATILDDIAGFEATATYNANDITVTLNAATADFANTVTARNLVFAAEAFTRIANNSPTGDMATVIAQLENQTGNNLVVAFEQIVPNYLVPQAEATFKGIDVQNNNFNGRFNELRNGLPKLWSNNLGVNTPDNASINDSADPEFAMMLAMQAQETLEQQQETARFTGAEKDIWGAWVNGFGTFGDYDSTSSQAGYNFNTGGVTFGFDYRVLDTLAAGAFVGYSNTGVTVDNGQGTNSFNSINTGMYMTWFNEEGFYASGLFGGGVNFYENNRRIRFGTVDRVAESDPTGFYLQTLATGGYEFKKGNWGFGPQLALQWVNLQIGSHSETGADSLNLNVGAFNGNSFVTRLGFRATYEYDTDAMLFVPELVGFWEHEYLDPINTVDVGVPAGGESFTYTGIGPGRDSGLIGVNLVGISHEAPVSFTLQYNVEFTPDDFIVNNVYAGVRISF